MRQVQKLWHRLDSSGDGRIDFNELSEWWQKTEQLVDQLEEAIEANTVDRLTKALTQAYGAHLDHESADEAAAALQALGGPVPARPKLEHNALHRDKATWSGRGEAPRGTEQPPSLFSAHPEIC